MESTERLSPSANIAGGPFTLPLRWHLERRLGAGGQAEVWLANDTQLDQLVAIKFYGKAYTGKARSRWRRELMLGRSLQHPHLVRIHELIEAEEGLALAMEYLPGGSLSDRLERGGPLSPAEVENVALHVLEALAYLHGNGIVHRDVKPSNVMLDADGILRLADLGVAKYLNPPPDATQTIQAPGSPAYMSPEQLQNGDVGPASDLYSLGITLYELLTGKLPYEGRSTYEVATSHLRGDLPDPKRIRPDCSRWLARFIRRLMEKRPEDRFPSANASLEALETHRGLLSRRAFKKTLLKAAIGTVLCAAVAIGYLGWRSATAGDRLAVRTNYEGNKLEGLSSKGQPVWVVNADAPIQQVVQADLYGNGARETVVVSFDPSESQNLYRSKNTHIQPEVQIVSADGKTLNTFYPEQNVLDTGHIVAPPLLIPTVKVLDLLGDGRRQILVQAHHRSLGPSYLWIYWPRKSRWIEILDHWGGWIYSVEPDKSSKIPCLRILGFNGLLASEPMEASLEVRPPWGGATMMFAGRTLPGAVASEYSRFRWYTPLPPAVYGHRDPMEGFSVDSKGNSRFLTEGKTLVLDHWGNPVPGPNAGRQLANQRLDLLSESYLFYLKAAGIGKTRAQQTIAALSNRFRGILKEGPEQAAFTQICARALARSGGPQEAIRMIQRALRKGGFNDSLTLNLGELLAIEGHLAQAQRVLIHGYLDEQTPAGGWLTTKVLGRIAIEGKDQRLLNKEELVLSNMGYSSSVGQVLAARARLWWNQPIQADAHLESYDLAPEGEAIACLARWRLHEIKPADVAAMTGSLRRNPDAAGECLIAKAMAELSLHHPNQAVTDCLEAERRLSEKSTCEFWAFQTMQLARACHATALLAADRRSEAVAMAKALLPRLRPELLPYVLTRKVLTDSPTAAR